MKKAKWCITGLILLLICVLQTEIRQYILSDLRSVCYYTTLISPVDQINAQRKETASQYRQEGIGVFSWRREFSDAHDLYVYVYTDAETEKNLNAMGIYEGRSESFLSGAVVTVFLPAEEGVYRNNETVLCFTRDDVEAINRIRRKLYEEKQIALTSLQGHWDAWLMHLPGGVMLLGYAFLLFLTWVDIEAGKKKDFLRISLGKAKTAILLENAAADILVYVFWAVFVHWLAVRFGYVDILDMKSTVLYLTVNSFLYFVIYTYRHKEILYGENLDVTVLADIYVLKAFTMFICVICLSFSVTQLTGNIQKMSSTRKLVQKEEWYFVEITGADMRLETPERNASARLPFVQAKLAQHSIGFSYPAIISEDYYGILITDNMSDMISEPRILNDLKDTDLHIFIPAEKGIDSKQAEELMRYEIEQMFGTNGRLTAETILYTQKINVNVMMRWEGKSNGYEMTDDQDTLYQPVFCVLTLSDHLAVNPEALMNNRWSDAVVYRLQDEEIKDEKASGHYAEFRAESVSDHYRSIAESNRRILQISSAIACFSLLMELLIILTAIRLEYTVNARLLALKKIFGYSLLRKNAEVFFLTFASSLIGLAVIVVLNRFLPVVQPDTAGTITWVLLAVECIFMAFMVMKTETERTGKILKGGSL